MKSVQLGRPVRRETRPPADDHLFLWTVFILLLCGVAVACWIGTFYIFNHPEIGFAYQLLNRLHKLDPPRRFELTAAPTGEFLTPDKLLERYGSVSAGQLTARSDDLLRSYLRNYDHQVTKVPYVTGRFTVLDARPLRDDRFISNGLIVLAQSVDVPAVLIEHFFPASKGNLAAMEHILTTGLAIELRRSYDLSAAIHVSAIGGGRLLISCMPLLYGPYGTTQSGAGFQLEPPKLLNVKLGLPAFRPVEIEGAEKRFAEYRKAVSMESAVASLPSKKAGPMLPGGTGVAKAATPFQLVPVARALPVVSATPAGLKAGGRLATKPAGVSGPPLLAAAPSPSPAATERPKSVMVARALPVNTPLPTPAATSSASPQPVLTTTSSSPAANDRIASWTIYRPGQLPHGRTLDLSQTSELADRGIGRDLLYLRGDFTVTAARENRAVLRPKQSSGEQGTGRADARVIVEVPPGIPTPQEGSTMQRGSDRPFQIVDVRHGADGQLNVYVREVTAP
jgi:hypothetical protein